MKILVEHCLYTPYTGEIHGGIEKSTYLQVKALHAAGHTVDLVAPKDSTLPCIKAPVWSGYYASRNGMPMQIKKYNDFIKSLALDYDRVILNHPLSSQSVLNPSNAEWLSRSTYINHNPTGWFVSGAAGMRMQTNVRWLRYCGGKALYLADINKQQLDYAWNHPKKGLQIRGQCCAGGVKRIGHSKFFDLDMFDRKLNQWIYPLETKKAKKPQGYLVAIGRPDASKRLHFLPDVARQSGKKVIVFTTSTNGPLDPPAKLFDLLKSPGIEHRLDRPHSEILDVLRRADCLVLPSKAENFSNVVCEAMAHGVPVCHLEPQEPLAYFPALSKQWGDFSANTLEERLQAQTELQKFDLLFHAQELLK